MKIFIVLAIFLLLFGDFRLCYASGIKHKSNSINKQKRKVVYSTIPFQLKDSRIPNGFNGHDLRQIYIALLKRYGKSNKDEFETTVQYNERLNKERNKPLYDNIKIGDDLVMMVDPTNTLRAYTSYDADGKKLSIRIDTESTHNWTYDWKMGIEGQEFSYRDKNFMGSNAFGVTRMVKSISKSNAVLAFNNYSDFDWNKQTGLKEVYLNLNNLSAEVAKKIKNSIRILFVFSIESPYVGEDRYNYDATIDSPTEIYVCNRVIFSELKEIIIYNKNTGEILSRQLPRGKEQTL